MLQREPGLPGEVERVHGTAVAIGHRAVLIRGPSGAGKSDLALRCLGLGPSTIINEPPKLVSDDQVILKRDGEQVTVSAPETIFGKLEVRGVGIMDVPAIAAATLALIADLVDPQQVERFPDPWPLVAILGIEIPLIRLAPFEPSSALKLMVALNMAPWPRLTAKA
jgi:HPr kinase/phosphorylase